MSLEQTIQAFKEHVSSLVGEPVSLQWPVDEQNAVHIFVYSITEDTSIRSAPTDGLAYDLRVLIFPNPENEYSMLDKVMQELYQNPVFEVGDLQATVTMDAVTAQDIEQIFIARAQPYRLSLAYLIRSMNT